MEEITTRFEIVRLAVKMADHETVAVQAKKLRDISLDEDLNEIISLLDTKNYRQALFLMKGYVDSLDDSFFDTPTPTPSAKKRKTAEVPQESPGLFDMMQPQVSKTINLDDMLRMTEESAEESVAYQEPEPVAESYITQAKEEVKKNEAYLDIHKNRTENKTLKPFEEKEEEVLSNIHGESVHAKHATEEIPEERVPQSEPEPVEQVVETIMSGKRDQVAEETEKPTIEEAALQPEGETEEPEERVNEVFESLSETEENTAALERAEEFEEQVEKPEVESTPKSERDAALPQETDQVYSGEEHEAASVESEGETLATEPDSEISLPPVVPVVKEIDTAERKTEIEETEKSVLKAKRKADYTKENRRYPPISYIDQKFRNMRHQFPQVAESEGGIIDEVKVLLRQVATEGYTENDIRDAILFFQEKKAAGELAEAAQMLLLAAASESKYAQLLLARELFKGEVLKADYPESFTQINRLAEHDYPEAICDLAQLYEYGYGIKKDKKTAQLLYEEAAEMGVQRAQKHVERLSSKKGILSAFFK